MMTDLKTYSPCFDTKLEVRISDINHGNHLGHDKAISLLYEARLRFLNFLTLSEINNDGVGIILASLKIDYKQEAFLGDKLNISLYLGELTPLSFNLFYKIINEKNNKEILTSITKQVFYDYTTKKVVRASQKISDLFKPFVRS